MGTAETATTGQPNNFATIATGRTCSRNWLSMARRRCVCSAAIGIMMRYMYIMMEKGSLAEKPLTWFGSVEGHVGWDV